MTIDTEIRHVTKPGANLFRELGFSAEEAKLLQAASRKQINDTQQLKEQLMSELAMETTSSQAGRGRKILMVSRPRVSDVVNPSLSVGRAKQSDQARLIVESRARETALSPNAGSSTAASFSNAGSISSSATHPYPISKPDMPLPGRKK
jgi:predicted XRE-type DNA-binding protein